MKKMCWMLLLAVTVFIFNACSKSDDGGSNNPVPAPSTTACDAVAKTWSIDVSPLISSFCNQAGCHNSGSTNGPGPLTNHAQVAAVASQVREAVRTGRMPQNATLTLDQRNKIICWIDNGAPNN